MKILRISAHALLLFSILWVIFFADTAVKIASLGFASIMLLLSLLTIRRPYDPQTNRRQLWYGLMPMIEYYRMRKEKLQKGDFLNQCANYSASVLEIDDFIEYWHKHETGNDLPEYLGMTDDEYIKWAKDSNHVLTRFIELRRQKLG